MAQAQAAVSTYDAVGNREDLSDLIHDVSPDETPFVSMCGSATADSTLHEWQTDALASSGDNAHIEGDDANPQADTQTTRLTNRTQILKKHVVVTGTQQDGMTHAGIANMVAYKTAKRMKEIKLDLERACIGVSNAMVAGNDTTAREMASFITYLTSNVSRGATGSNPAGDGSDTPGDGTQRAFAESLLTTVLQSCFNNGANPKQIVLNSTDKGLLSGFTGGGTHYVDKDDKKLVNSVDVYVGDFHTLTAVPSREIRARDVLLVDPEYVKLADLRAIHSYELGKQGDSYRKEIVWETTLENCNEKAHGGVFDTNG